MSERGLPDENRGQRSDPGSRGGGLPGLVGIGADYAAGAESAGGQDAGVGFLCPWMRRLDGAPGFLEVELIEWTWREFRGNGCKVGGMGANGGVNGGVQRGGVGV